MWRAADTPLAPPRTFQRPDPPAPEPPASDLSVMRLVARLRSNGIVAWPERAYRESFLHRRYLGVDSYLVNDPDEARRIFLADVDVFERPLGFRRLYRPIFGGGLLLAEGAQSRKQRRRIAPAFSARHVERLIPRFLAVGSRMLVRLAGESHANLSKAFQDAAIDAIGSAALSVSLDPISSRIAAFRTSYFRCGARVSIFDHFARREGDFFLDHGIRGRSGRIGRAIVAEIIELRRNRSEDALGAPDLLDLLLAAQRANPESLTDVDILDEVATILGTGFDTAGRSMFWLAFLLAIRPEAQAVVRDEVRRFRPGEVRHLADLDRWPYLRQCLWEAMRLYPPLQGIVRVPLGPVEICGQRVEPRSYVAVSPWVMHRHHMLWDRPSAFVPERFPVDPVAAMRTRGFIPFGMGARTCIGAAFALAEITLLLAQLFERYEIGLGDNHSVMPMSIVTTIPSVEPMFRLRTLAP
ncbi:cytochrome P450 [Sphingosinicella sp.]|uniref:cytochrome P450 n=1 Tax=Sphingosinicella sp. TaxID=1917971 RepID=UPI004037A263